MEKVAKEQKEKENQGEPKHVETSVADMLAKMDAIASECEGDNKRQVEELNKYYQDVVFEELKNVHKAAVAVRIQEEIIGFKSETIYEDHLRRANLILNKYEILTREYQNQNKSLKENHERIIKAEQEKRKDIISNFENHLTMIK